MEHLGDSYAEEDPAAAEVHFRGLLAEHPSLNGTSHPVEISLAELLIDKGDRPSTEEALALLTRFSNEARLSPECPLPLASGTHPHRSGHRREGDAERPHLPHSTRAARCVLPPRAARREFSAAKPRARSILPAIGCWT